MHKGHKRLSSIVFAGVVAALAGCNGNPLSGSPAYKEGKLGNGGFLFKCDDSVACDRWSTNSAKDFPDAIATGSNFEVRFVANDSQGSTIRIGDKEYVGVVSEAVGPFVGHGPEGFSALRPGYGTVMAKDSRGYVIDFVTIKIVQPDGLVVYDAAYTGTSPPAIETVALHVSSAAQWRTVAQQKKTAIAGSVQVVWKSSAPEVADVESYTRGVAKIVGKSPGTATLTAEGAALTKTITVEVAL